VFLILSSLASGPLHGYAILQEIQSLTNGRVRLSTGTLYGALRRLLEEGSIRRFKEKQAPRDRQAYELTAGGHQALAAEVDRMRSLVTIASARFREKEA
jgi:DNA-binding PadR family transcriptional regulator